MILKSIKFGSDDFRKECELRDQVLRAPLALSLEDEDLEGEKHQEHFGLFDEAGNLVACVIVVPLSPAAAKIRQMAVAPGHQSQGHGQCMLRCLEDCMAKKGWVQVHLHARLTALAFYEKLGYVRVGPDFMEVGLPHLRMEKRLSESKQNGLDE